MFLQSYIFFISISGVGSYNCNCWFRNYRWHNDYLKIWAMTLKNTLKLPGTGLIKSNFAPGNVCNYKLWKILNVRSQISNYCFEIEFRLVFSDDWLILWNVLSLAHWVWFQTFESSQFHLALRWWTLNSWKYLGCVVYHMEIRIGIIMVAKIFFQNFFTWSQWGGISLEFVGPVNSKI